MRLRMRLNRCVPFVFFLCATAAGRSIAFGQQPPDAVKSPTQIEPPAGVGLALAKDGDRIVVGRVIPGTPAAASGRIHEKDQILAIAEGDEAAVTVEGRGIGEVVPMLKGRKGTTVRVTIVPAGNRDSESRVVSLVRAEFDLIMNSGDGKLLKEGADAPDVSLVRLPGGEPDRLWRYRGKIVVLTFWATWCGPCQDEMADLQTLAAKHPVWADKVVLLTASTDERREDAVKRLKERGWDKTQNAWVEKEALWAYHVDHWPTVYVIGPDRKVAAADPRDAAAVVDKLLAKPPK